MNTKKTRLEFTAEELEILNTALNNYGLEQMNTSNTYGKADYDRMDVWHRNAYAASALWRRVYMAQKRIGER